MHPSGSDLCATGCYISPGTDTRSYVYVEVSIFRFYLKIFEKTFCNTSITNSKQYITVIMEFSDFKQLLCVTR